MYKLYNQFMKQSENLTKPVDLQTGNMVLSLKPRHLDTNDLTPNLLDHQQIKRYYGIGKLIYGNFYFEGYPLNLQLSTLKNVNGVTMIDSVIDITDEPTEDELIRLLEYMERGVANENTWSIKGNW